MAPADPPLAPTARPLFEQGLRLHNEGEFYEAHEAWEQIWAHETDDDFRLFVQGLIQVTSAFHKVFFQREPRGAARLLERGLDKLDKYPSDYLGVALGPFRDGVRPWIALLAALEPKSPAIDRIDRAVVPRLCWIAQR